MIVILDAISKEYEQSQYKKFEPNINSPEPVVGPVQALVRMINFRLHVKYNIVEYPEVEIQNTTLE